MNFIGIDPGKSGGMAIIRSDEQISLVKLDCTPADVWLSICCGGMYGEARALLEEMAVFPMKQPGAIVSLTKLFRHQGILVGLLTAAKIPFESIQPSKWQRTMGCLTKGDKKVTYRKAQELFPQVKVTHWNADALLLAECCRRLYHQRNGQ